MFETNRGVVRRRKGAAGLLEATNGVRKDCFEMCAIDLKRNDMLGYNMNIKQIHNSMVDIGNSMTYLGTETIPR